MAIFENKNKGDFIEFHAKSNYLHKVKFLSIVVKIKEISFVNRGDGQPCLEREGYLTLNLCE